MGQRPDPRRPRARPGGGLRHGRPAPAGTGAPGRCRRIGLAENPTRYAGLADGQILETEYRMRHADGSCAGSGAGSWSSSATRRGGRSRSSERPRTSPIGGSSRSARPARAARPARCRHRGRPDPPGNPPRDPPAVHRDAGAAARRGVRPDLDPGRARRDARAPGQRGPLHAHRRRLRPRAGRPVQDRQDRAARAGRT